MRWGELQVWEYLNCLKNEFFDTFLHMYMKMNQTPIFTTAFLMILDGTFEEMESLNTRMHDMRGE